MFGSGKEKPKPFKAVDFDQNRLDGEKRDAESDEQFRGQVEQDIAERGIGYSTERIRSITDGKIDTVGEKMGSLFARLGKGASSLWESTGRGIKGAHIALENAAAGGMKRFGEMGDAASNSLEGFVFDSVTGAKEVAGSVAKGAGEAAGLAAESANHLGGLAWEGAGATARYLDNKLAEGSDAFDELLNGAGENLKELGASMKEDFGTAKDVAVEGGKMLVDRGAMLMDRARLKTQNAWRSAQTKLRELKLNGLRVLANSTEGVTSKLREAEEKMRFINEQRVYVAAPEAAAAPAQSPEAENDDQRFAAAA